MNYQSADRHKTDATEEEVCKRRRNRFAQIVQTSDMGMIVSNIGVDPGFSALFSPNSAMHTAFMQVALKPEITRPAASNTLDRGKVAPWQEMPELPAFYSVGSLVDGVLNMGMPAAHRRPSELERT